MGQAARPSTIAFASYEPYPSALALLEEAARVVGLEELPEADGLLCDWRLRIDESLLARAPKLRAISLVSVGYENVDAQACARRGIPFFTVRGSLDEAVADLAYALILASFRKLLPSMAWASSGRWMSELPPYGNDLEAKTLGIVGFGRIGLALARRAQASRMRVVYHNRRPREDDAATGAAFLPFNALLASADCVLALVPLSPATSKMFGAAQFGLMKPTAHFVNVGRGGLVDTQALLEALRSGRIAAAALDVTDPEPLAPEHPFYAMPNVLIVPHIGSATHETRERMMLQAARNLVAGLRGQALPDSVKIC